MQQTQKHLICNNVNFILIPIQLSSFNTSNHNYSFIKTKRMAPLASMLNGIAIAVAQSPPLHLQPTPHHHIPLSNKLALSTMSMIGSTLDFSVGKRARQVRCGAAGISDFIGGDLLKPDLGRWLSDVEEHKAIAIYTPHEGGYEGRYLNRLRHQGFYFLDLSARGLGDPETTLTKIHPVCPAHLGKQPIARWYFPPEVDYRLSALPPNAKGLVVWIIEAKVLSKAELQFLALLPTLRPKVRVIAECGNWRKFMWKPLKEIAGLTAIQEP